MALWRSLDSDANLVDVDLKERYRNIGGIVAALARFRTSAGWVTLTPAMCGVRVNSLAPFYFTSGKQYTPTSKKAVLNLPLLFLACENSKAVTAARMLCARYAVVHVRSLQQGRPGFAQEYQEFQDSLSHGLGLDYGKMPNDAERAALFFLVRRARVSQAVHVETLLSPCKHCSCAFFRAAYVHGPRRPPLVRPIHCTAVITDLNLSGPLWPDTLESSYTIR